jgi:hypothetical protein
MRRSNGSADRSGHTVRVHDDHVQRAASRSCSRKTVRSRRMVFFCGHRSHERTCTACLCRCKEHQRACVTAKGNGARWLGACRHPEGKCKALCGIGARVWCACNADQCGRATDPCRGMWRTCISKAEACNGAKAGRSGRSGRAPTQTPTAVAWSACASAYSQIARATLRRPIA